MGKNSSPVANGSSSTFSSHQRTLLHAVDEFQGRQLIDRLRELGLDQYVELPQIAVMGDASSGKSSLLSALSGVTFPSSSDLTTRRVRLHRFQKEHSEQASPIHSIDEVPLEIERLTKQLVEEGNVISDDAIIIEIRGPELPNLTLTDLPGIVRAVSDKEDRSLIPRVRDLVNRYMKQTRTIIMAVVPANVDMHNVEILENAQEADPDGIRTIAVVTKLDLIDRGAEHGVDELLRNRKKKLELGYHGVKCRGQQDLNDGVTVAAGLQHEQVFFSTHEFWSKLPRKSWGIEQLTKKLVDILQSNIERTLPQVIKDISTQMNETNAELGAMGSALDSAVARRELFVKLADGFIKPMQAVLKGDYDALGSSSLVDASGVDLRLRAQIRLRDELFKEQIEATAQAMPGSSDIDTVQRGDLVLVERDGIDESFRVDSVNDRGEVQCTAYTLDDWLGSSRYKPHPLNHLRRFIVQNRGDELFIFPPYGVFCSILSQWVGAWQDPMLELVRRYRELTQAVAIRIVGQLHAPARVQHYLETRVTTLLDKLTETVEEELEKELARERRPYTQNEQLTTTYTELLRPGLESLLRQKLSISNGRVDFAQLLNVLTAFSHANDEQDTVIMDCALRAYFQTAMTRFVDAVPMVLNATLLETFVARMASDLRTTSDEQLERLLRESELTQSRRSELETKLTTLRKAKRRLKSSCETVDSLAARRKRPPRLA